MGLKLHNVKALPKVDELFEKNWLSAILLEIIGIYSFGAGEKLATGLKLHQVKALPKVDE